MKRKGSPIGCRAAIVSTFHSHAFVRAHASALIGREGVVVAVLRNGTAGLVKLDDDADDLPGGARCWLLQWDDLELQAPAERVPPRTFVTGWSKSRRTVVFHAVRPKAVVAVCSSPVKPLPMCGWSVSFSHGMSGACPKCVTVINAL